MQFTKILTLLAATTINHAAAQGGSSGGGWYVVTETLLCTGTCEPPRCIMIGPPSDDQIRSFCRRIYDDCADGVLNNGQQSEYFPAFALVGTGNFGTGPQHGNNGCPNNDDCFLSFRSLSLNMGYKTPYCSAASVRIYGHYNHLPTGSIMMSKQRYFVEGPFRQSENVTFTA